MSAVEVLQVVVGPDSWSVSASVLIAALGVPVGEDMLVHVASIMHPQSAPCSGAGVSPVYLSSCPVPNTAPDFHHRGCFQQTPFDIDSFLEEPQIKIYKSNKIYPVHIDPELKTELQAKNQEKIQELIERIKDVEKKIIAPEVLYFTFGIFDDEIYYEGFLGKIAK